MVVIGWMLAVVFATDLPVEWHLREDIGGGLRRVQTPQIQDIVDVMGTQQNLISDVELRFQSRNEKRGQSQVQRYSGSWMFDSNRKYERETINYFMTDSDAPTWTEEFGFDGVESREYSTGNNGGNFSASKFHSNVLTFPFDPSIWFAPLWQEDPDASFSDLLTGKVEMMGQPLTTTPSVIGMETLTLAEGLDVDTVVVDVELKGVSFKVKLWLDPSRDYWPRRVMHYSERDTGKTDILLDYTVDELKSIQAAGGTLYIPVKGRIAGVERTPEGDNVYSETTLCEVTDFKVNQGLAAEEYKYEWLEGTRVLNLDTSDWGYNVQDAYVPGDVWEALNNAKMALPDEVVAQSTIEPGLADISTPSPSPATSVPTPTPVGAGQSSFRSVAAALLASLVLCLGALLWRKKHSLGGMK